jgi:hypothetical protein
VEIPEKGPQFLPIPSPACKHNSTSRTLGQAMNQRLDLWQALSHNSRPYLRIYQPTR